MDAGHYLLTGIIALLILLNGIMWFSSQDVLQGIRDAIDSFTKK